ncbi:Lrp/AsnC family transcriptional regulator [Aneurinibacillus sp. Ricciae_BoGa-3]|uniref:Lrp/AsnC family transcriptional regulator n=1 Tax=Aneurinibacillus sp. Ricciae_BoGa-3 TaxID=3022697 RepID=UPI002342420A|nr:Lrp/AsnC family transcriptional regulator [Aneurinibacillus sp. Ricciae_BoGa-3]WCK55967.1 Lrp/AsnC family transcriptional regulator [Aneurinibacillus sp. Ricciae_BoGa-3]
MKKLDILDFQILQMLQEDARRAYTDMGSQLGVSEGTIRARINRMLEDEVFEFIIHTVPQKVGLDVQAIIGMSTKLGSQEQVALQLGKLPPVRFIGAFSGRNDLIIQAYFPSNDALVSFVNEDLSTIDGIVSAEVSIELKQYKDSFSYVRYEELEDTVG